MHLCALMVPDSEESMIVGQKKGKKCFIFSLIEVRKVVYVEYDLVFRYVIQNTRKQKISVSNFVNF